MPSVHTCFIYPTKKQILSNTELTHTTAVYVIPCLYQAWHIAHTFMHHDYATNEATSFRLNYLNPWSKILSNDMLL